MSLPQRVTELGRGLDRRAVVAGVAGATACAVAARRAFAGRRRVVVANFGGAIARAKQAAIYDPFTRATGIEVIAVPGPSLAKIKLQSESATPEWDVVDLLASWLPVATRLNLLEPVDERTVKRDGCLPQAHDAHAVGASIACSGIGYARRRTPMQPKSWPEFWDVRRFPGRRGLLRRITETLEAALLADGVPPDRIYPCDVERAFRALDRLKPNIRFWISQTEQTVSLIQQDEADFTHTYSTRVKNMEAAGVDIGFSFEQNLLSVLWTGVLRGSRNRDAAMQLLAFVADPQRQAALSSLSGDAPTYVSALHHVPAAARRWMPDISNPRNLFIDARWWDPHLEPLTLRFQDWLFS